LEAAGSSRNSSPSGQAESARQRARESTGVRPESPRILRITLRAPRLLDEREGEPLLICGEIEAVINMPMRTNTPPTIVVWYTFMEIPGPY